MDSRKSASSLSSGNETASFKVVLLGDAAVGKTCIFNRIANNVFTDTVTTIGNNLATKNF